jgi:phospholipase C
MSHHRVGWTAHIRAACRAAALIAALLGAAAAARAQTTPIQNVIIIMQEKRSFDAYFGTFPGADGIPMVNGVPSVCNNDPATGVCVAPFHSFRNNGTGGPVTPSAATIDIDGGAMDGFIAAAETPTQAWPGGGCATPGVDGCKMNVMAYSDSREIPNYWAYAETFVLQDHMFAGVGSYGGPAHLQLLSGWSAVCANGKPSSCQNSLLQQEVSARIDAWTDITYLLFKAGVSWGYYNFEPINGPSFCGETLAHVFTPLMWNPLPCFETVAQDGQLGNIQNITNFYAQAAAGTLPSVSWVAPNWLNSEHQSAKITDGQAFVTGVVNAVMQGPQWSNCAIFITYADWGGYYDHEPPPVVDAQGYGMRVPGLLISPYARAGMIDHQVLSHDAYLKFIEDNWLGGQRLDPASDGRPDPRPDVRETAAVLGDLMNEFDFTQTPLPPLVLAPYPGTGPTPKGAK